jgi:hypothetical protein
METKLRMRTQSDVKDTFVRRSAMDDAIVCLGVDSGAAVHSILVPGIEAIVACLP